MSEINDLIVILERSTNWADIFKGIKNISNSGKVFESLCKYYYLAEPAIKNDYKNVWLFSELPLQIKNYLTLAETDHGVDLILEDKFGRFSVVQCKFRSDQNSFLSWSKDKIANLFAEGDKADNLIVFTNASGLDKHSLKKGSNKFKIITLGDLLELNAETIQNMLLLAKGKIPNTLIKYEPRPYQQEAIDSVISGFNKFNRGQLILPCGAGKTLVALWIKESLKSKKTLVVVPSLALLRQIKQEWNTHEKKWVKYICVCSEQDISKSDNLDNPEIHEYEINGKVTTNPQEILEFLSTEEEVIVYSTYQSLKVISEAILKSHIVFDFAICDEAHKTAGTKLTSFGLIHDEIKIPIKKRMYMTATPRIVSDEVKTKLSDEEIEYLADMSDINTFGPEFYRMSFKEAIMRDILVDYQIIAIGISDEDVRNKILNRELVNEKETAEDIANNFSLYKAMLKYKANHVITFHSSINRAINFMNRHKEHFPKINISHVSGRQTTNKRNLIINEFKNERISIVTNARCLTEGVDIPIVDLVFFSDPKYSKIDIVQASGRALRKAKNRNKKLGYIVIPLYHNNENDIEDIIKTSSFKKIISVVRAMCDQDERLQAEINEIMVRRGSPKLNFEHVKVEIDELPLLVLENFKQSLKSKIFDQIVRKNFDSWEMKYNLLKNYYSEFQNWPSNMSHYKNIKLGKWCKDQRKNFGAGKLLPERIKKLESINFVLRNPSWDDRFELLKKYRVANPNSWPKINDYYEDFSIGAWCAKERQMYKSGAIQSEKKEKLDSINFPFLNQKYDSWETRFERLKRFRELYPFRWPYPQEKFENIKMAPWCTAQRLDFKNHSLKREKIDKLNTLNFVWENPVWDQHFNLFSEFKNSNPVGWPPLEKDDNGINLRLWCIQQGFLFKHGKLPQEKVELLKSINFDLNAAINLKQGWDKKKLDKWQKLYACLVEFRMENPNNWPSAGVVWKDEQIGKWCASLRGTNRQNLLPLELKQQLDNINFQWELNQKLSLDLSWNEHYENLKEFRSRFKNRWPANDEKFKKFSLGNWCNSQRSKYKNKKILPERKKLLNKINFVWKNTIWEENYEILKRYRIEHPNKWPRPLEMFEEVGLGNWLARQKKLYWKNKLDKSQSKRLEVLNLF